MAVQRLTQVVTFKRIKPDAARDEAGQVDDSLATNWHAIGKRRGDVAQLSSSESHGSDQQQTSASYSVVCRGDELTRSVTQQDRMELVKHGRFIILNITGIRTTNDVPHYIEFTGDEG